ncbi:MAG TPA: DUF6491 family protein [Aromatoleum sp.]|uniref:DUF6491 family protein n=1 Tax=Aromatoleum sp. TaxID=2307007 RepID=UPI002B495CBC|nr:DUF6491 family protein [Aromatoleum sp.]HJV27192.1 DUF6491 family protein [Aromatoleum sp.]
MAPFFQSSRWRAAVAVRMRLCALTACLSVAAAAAAGAQASGGNPPAPVSAAAVPFAAPNATPMRSVRVFRIYGWRSLEPRTAILWLGVDEPYILKVRGDCREQDQSIPTALALRDSHLVPGRDRLQFASGACVIDSLVRADRNKLRANSITPDAANAIRLIQEAPPQRKPR